MADTIVGLIGPIKIIRANGAIGIIRQIWPIGIIRRIWPICAKLLKLLCHVSYNVLVRVGCR